MTKSILRIGYCEFVLDAKAAQAVFEALDGTAIDTEFLSNDDADKYETTRGQLIKPADQQRLSCVLVSRHEYEDMRERYNAVVRYEMRRDLETEEALREWQPETAVA